MKRLALLALVVLTLAATQPESNLNSIEPDLKVPETQEGPAAAGKRVRMTTRGWEGTQVHHALYLPRDWKAGGKLPVIVEYPGNGGYRNKLGDASDGTVEGCKMGYGLSGGAGYIWIAMPFVVIQDGVKRNTPSWWGDVEESKRYCMATVSEVCERFGGDADRVVLAGFSRGAIACNCIGLHDDAIAKLWRGFFCHSHYDGVMAKAWYPEGERAAALQRLARLKGRPQWISHEETPVMTETYLKKMKPEGRFTFRALPFPNHTDAWLLRDLPIREEARAWLREVTR